ncbi:SUKH-4 family immunity protein [Streptomyces anulatus]|uniref:SUKH-4 family immunity protein n=1 Tax=Streptomyces anulatus TaxID=1892 RepID=UPI0036C33BE3
MRRLRLLPWGAQRFGASTVCLHPAFRADTQAPNSSVLVGLPHSEVFTSREDVEAPYPTALDAITPGSRFDHYGTPCPAESRSWWTLGYLFTSLIALDPASGKVCAFPEGSSGYLPLHRDVESLVYALIEFRKLEVDHDSDVDPEELSARFRKTVGAFDSTPSPTMNRSGTARWRSWNTASGNTAAPWDAMGTGRELLRVRRAPHPGHRAAAGPGHDSSPPPPRSCPRSAEGPRKPLIGCRTSPTTRTCEFKSDQAGGSCLGTHIRIHVRDLQPSGAVTAPDPGRS